MRVIGSMMMLAALGLAGGAHAGEPRILSAYFGIDDLPISDNAAPRGQRCQVDGDLDGLPIVLSHEVDQDTLEPAHLSVVTQSGARLTPVCAMMAPAQEENEDRTILMLGEFGTAESDPPVRVEIVGPIMTEADGAQGAVSLQGLASPAVTDVADGPFLVFAEVMPAAEWEVSDTSDGPDCPADTTAQILRLTWAGGITQEATEPGLYPPGRGDELGPEQYARIHVVLAGPDGSERMANPFYIGDRSDGDNNNDLCLDDAGTPLRVRVEAGTVTDPGNDWNPETEITVSGAGR